MITHLASMVENVEYRVALEGRHDLEQLAESIHVLVFDGDVKSTVINIKRL